MAKLLETLLLLVFLSLLVSCNNPASFAVTTDSSVANVIVSAGFPWVPAVVMVSAIAGVSPPVVVITAVDGSGGRPCCG